MKRIDWPIGALRRFASIVNGGTPTADGENWGGNIPWATPVDLGRVDGEELGATERTLTPRGLSSGSSAVPAGSCLLSTRAPIGYAALVEATTAFNQGCKGVVPRSGIDPRFLLLLLVAAREQIISMGQGSTFTELSAIALGGLSVAVPPLASQRSIADYLDRETEEIDAFIADQEELIALLEERRSGVLQRSLKGDLSVEWETVPLRRLTSVKRGASPRPIDDPKYFDEDGFWSWVRIQDVTASGGHLLETKQRLSELGASLSVRLEPGSLFLSIAATVGRPCITDIPCCIHDGFVYFPGLRPELIPYLFRVFESGGVFAGLGKFGTQLNLNTNSVGGIHVPMPPLHELPRLLRELDHQTHSADAAIADAREAIALSKERRAALISAAVAGQIDVTEKKRVLI